MFVSFGHRFYGKIDVLDGAFVVTRFAHFQMLPIFPLESFLIVTTPDERAIALGRFGPSVIAAYARIWSLVAAFVGLALADQVSPWIGWPLFTAAVLTAVWAWVLCGRLSRDAIARRRAYAAFAGAPIDVALVARATRGAHAADAKRWLATITERAEASIATEGVDLAPSYRGSARHVLWERVAERPGAATPECQRAALVLSRLASAEGDAAARATAAAAHERIWEALSR
jgi:hypothetical protein